MTVNKPRYNRDGWPLTLCASCGRARYCEPHGTTAACACDAEWTESIGIPFEYGDGHIRLTKQQHHAVFTFSKLSKEV